MNRRNNKKGFAFAVTVVFMLALFVLGLAVLGLSTSESKLTSMQYNRTQSYYSARSGIEVGLKKFQDLIATGMYDEVSTLYTDINTAFTGSITPGKDVFNVSYIDGGLVQQDKIKILSQATQNGSTMTTAVTIHFLTPDYLPLDWLNPGQIMRKGFFERSEGPVVVKTAKLLGHAPKKSSTAITIWKAPEIHFVDYDGGFSFEITAKSIEFQTNLLSFKKKVYTSNKTNDDSFVLNTFDPLGFVKLDKSALLYGSDISEKIPDHWGVLVLKEDFVYGANKNSTPETLLSAGYYAFAPGTKLSDSTGRNSLIPITNSTSKAYIDSVIRKSTSLELNPVEMLWSKN